LRNGSRNGTQASIPTTSSSMLLFFFKLPHGYPIVAKKQLRFWEARNVKKGGELMDVDLVVLMESNRAISMEHQGSSASDHVSSVVLMAEALAVRAALQSAILLDISTIKVNSDNQTLIRVIYDTSSLASENVFTGYFLFIVNSDPGANQPAESRNLFLMEFFRFCNYDHLMLMANMELHIQFIPLEGYKTGGSQNRRFVLGKKVLKEAVGLENDDENITSDDQRNNSSHVRTDTEKCLTNAFLEALLLRISTLATGFIPQLLQIYLNLKIYNAELTRLFSSTTESALILGMIVTSALIIWKALMCVTGTESPVVVVLSRSMEPAFKRGNVTRGYIILTYDQGSHSSRRDGCNWCYVLCMIVTSALIIWKALMCVTGTESPVVVVLSRSMEPAFKRGNVTRGYIILTYDQGSHSSRRDGCNWCYVLCDKNDVDNMGLYADGQFWLHRHHIMGRAVGNVFLQADLGLAEEHNISSSSATTALAPLLWKTLNGGKCRGFFSVGMVMPYTCLKNTDQSTYRKEEEWKNVAALP
ncbi:hypothetical protein F2Q69_00008244, partial [Brassica cretica]